MNSMLALLPREAILLLLLLLGAALVIAALRRADTRRAAHGPRNCPNTACRHVNPPNAQYCAACGRRLRLRKSPVP